MRFKCTFFTEKLPVANKMMFLSLIKDSIKKVSKDYYENMYNYEGKNNKKTKNFCFSIFIKDFTIKEEIIEVKDRVILNISTPEYELGINIYNGLLNIKQFKYKDFTLVKQGVSLIKEKQIKDEEVVFKTLSPLCIKDKNNRFLAPMQDEYEYELNYIADKILDNYRGYGLMKPLKFQQVLMKKKVVKEEIRNFTKETNKKNFYVNAYSGIFKLAGDKDDLNLIYQIGLGFRRSQGFGCIEVV